jgi:NitT/TauT family transport system substrate-binding protein
MLLLQALTLAVGGTAGSPEYLPVRIADAQGDFAREGLTVTVKSTRSESGAAEALAQGQADLAATSLEAVLRFGHRQGATLPRVVFGLTAAPPVALLVGQRRGGDVTTLGDLTGARIGFAAPGGSEQTWLQAALARQRLDPSQVELMALGSRGVILALDSGDVRAAVVAEPAASTLVDDGRARVLVDLRSPAAVRQALGVPTVNAAVFVRAERRIGDRELVALARALLAAQQRIATESPAALADRLAKPVVGAGDEFARRVAAARAASLPNGLVEPDAVKATIAAIRAHVPLPHTLRVPRPEDLLHLEPLRRALGGRPAPGRAR